MTFVIFKRHTYRNIFFLHPAHLKKKTRYKYIFNNIIGSIENTRNKSLNYIRFFFRRFGRYCHDS